MSSTLTLSGAVYELLLFTAATYGCLHVERNYSLSLLSHLYLTLSLTLGTASHPNIGNERGGEAGPGARYSQYILYEL